jgi:hypothetical protein
MQDYTIKKAPPCGDAKAEADGFPLIENSSVQYNESLPDIQKARDTAIPSLRFIPLFHGSLAQPA